MSQDIWSTINPATTSGTQLATLLDNFKNSLMTTLSGTSRPTELDVGGLWVDDTDPDILILKMWNGTVDIEIARVVEATGKAAVNSASGTFEVDQYSADTAGAIMKFVKRRIASNGQVADGDVIGEMQFVGRTDTSTDPIVARIKTVSTDAETTSAFGAYMVFEATVDATASLVEMMRLVDGKLGVGTTAPASVIHGEGATGVRSSYNADSANPALLVTQKGRLAGNKSSQSADELGRWDIYTTDDASAKVLSAQVVSSASEAHTASARGTLLDFKVSTTGTTTPTSKFAIGDTLESKVRHKLTGGIEWSSQDVATTATIAQLSATTPVVEMTGSTATSIQGINSVATGVKEITIHNRSSATVTLAHENGTASANDRMTLPGAVDFAIIAQASAILYYCTADTRWKIRASFTPAATGKSTTIVSYFGDGTFTVPAGVTVAKVRAFPKSYPSFCAYHGVNSLTGQVYGWGANTNGQIGDSTVAHKSNPSLLSSSLRTDFRRMSTDVTDFVGSSFGITADGTAFAWGKNANGQLGDNSVTPKSVPTAVVGGLKFRQIAHAQNTAVGITEDGTAYAWGLNANGQLGDGTVTPKSSPVAVLGGFRFKKVAAGNGFCLGLTFGGDIYGWGANTVGEIADGTAVPKSSPVIVVGGLKFKDIAANYQGGYGLTVAGAAYGWGQNQYGSVGDGTVTKRSSPVAVLGSLVFDQLAAGYIEGYGILADGTAYGWGYNGSGQLGIGNVTPQSSPVAVLGSLKWLTLTSGGGTTFGITTGGVAYAWGQNNFGQLGNNNSGVHRSSPVLMSGSILFVDHDRPTPIGYSFTVTPADVIDVLVQNAYASFGHKSLGYICEKVEVEYDS